MRYIPSSKIQCYGSFEGGARTACFSETQKGFSLVELIVSMVITLMILGIAVGVFSGALGSRDRESSKTDALTSAQAALNIMSREIGNSGYGLTTNGLVLADCNGERLHIRANTVNQGNSMATNSPGEDLTFYYDAATDSVVRYDNVAGASGLINRISFVNFVYYNYAANGTFTAGAASLNTGRIRITLTVELAEARGQPTNRTVTLTSDVTLRNSPYMLGQY